MKYVISFIKTCIAGLILIFLIILFYEDDTNLLGTFILLTAAKVFLIGFLYWLIYFPVFLLNRNAFSKKSIREIYYRYLWIPLIPFILVLSIATIVEYQLWQHKEWTIAVCDMLAFIYITFYSTIRSIKKIILI